MPRHLDRGSAASFGDDLRPEYDFASMRGGVRGKHAAILRLDELMLTSLAEFADDTLGTSWCGKENDWVNRFAHGYLLRHVSPGGVLRDAAQIAIEVAVPQPPGYARAGTHRDLVIWPQPNGTCWDAEWQAVHHPIAIVEWKVHRPKRRNRDQLRERDWLRRYTRWQPRRVAYAVEIDLGCSPSRLVCHRYLNGKETVLLETFAVSGETAREAPGRRSRPRRPG